MNLTHEQKQEVRHATRDALVLRHPAALAPRQIWHVVKKELDFAVEEADVSAACELLLGLGQVEALTDELGAGRYWRASSTGVLARERE
jgi:hypothetical protein